VRPAARAGTGGNPGTQGGTGSVYIKDKDVAVSPEQQSRMLLGDELLEEQIGETFARHKAEPQSVDLAKRLGLLHDQKEDFEGAIAWYQYAVDLTNKSDPSLLRKVANLKMKQLERRICEEDQYLMEHGKNDAEFAQKIAALELAKKQRSEIFITDARERLDRNPADLQLRYELGERLTNAGEYRDADGCQDDLDGELDPVDAAGVTDSQRLGDERADQGGDDADEDGGDDGDVLLAADPTCQGRVRPVVQSKSPFDVGRVRNPSSCPVRL
jgi:tetratricopeptide (TPR) repeat protein